MANVPRRPKGQEQKVADPRRGEIYFWFDPAVGREIKKTRRTVDRQRLARRLGAVDSSIVAQVDEALKISLGLVRL